MTIGARGAGNDSRQADRHGMDTKSADPVQADETDSAVPSDDEITLAAKVAQIRARIADGVYDDPAMAEEVARRLLESGDVDPDA